MSPLSLRNMMWLFVCVLSISLVCVNCDEKEILVASNLNDEKSLSPPLEESVVEKVESIVPLVESSLTDEKDEKKDNDDLKEIDGEIKKEDKMENEKEIGDKEMTDDVKINEEEKIEEIKNEDEKKEEEVVEAAQNEEKEKINNEPENVENKENDENSEIDVTTVTTIFPTNQRRRLLSKIVTTSNSLNSARLLAATAAYDKTALPSTPSSFVIQEKILSDNLCNVLGMHLDADSTYYQACAKDVTTTTSTSSTTSSSTTMSTAAPAREAFMSGEPRLRSGKIQGLMNKVSVSENRTVPSRSFFQKRNLKTNESISKVSAESADVEFNSITELNNKLVFSITGSMDIISYDKETNVKEASSFKLDYSPKSLSFDSENKKVYITDNISNKIYIHNMESATLEKLEEINVICNNNNINTIQLSNNKYIKPYLYINIFNTGYIIRVNMMDKKCDLNFLLDLSSINADVATPVSTNNDLLFTEKDAIISSLMIDNQTNDDHLPSIYIAGNKWEHIYKLSNHSNTLYIVQTLSILGFTALVQFF